MTILTRWPSWLGRALFFRRSMSICRDLMTQRHLEEAISWLSTARKSSCDGGIPAYFDLLRGRWTSSYPETTGYVIPTLISCAARLRRPDLYEFAIALSDYLLGVRTAEGGVGHWKQQEGKGVEPVIFDTGQVILGWLAAWQETNNQAYWEAIIDAADWLVDVQDESGAWIRYQHLGVVKVIDTRVALALLKVAQVSSLPSYVAAARRNLDWALSQQQPNGWFRQASFWVGKDPFTHTIAYTAEGLLECGLILDERRYVASAEKVARVLMEKQRPDGSLCSTYDAAWRSTSCSSCLTGNCQMALIWLRFFGLSGDARYLDVARKAIAFVASTQDLRTSDTNIRGAIAGSYPTYGRYARFQYPNWAAKFFIDALLAVQEVDEQPHTDRECSGCQSKV